MRLRCKTDAAFLSDAVPRPRNFTLLPYWLLFVMWMLAAFAYNRTLATNDSMVSSRPRSVGPLYLLVIATAALMGLRFEIGADWFNYLDNYDMVQLLAYPQALGTFDAGYATLVFIASHLNVGMWLVNSICAIIMTLGIMRFCARQHNPPLTFLVAVPYLIIVVGMGYTRQGVAIGLILAGLADADGRSIWKLILYIMAAALFHRTALLVLPLALAPLARRNLLQTIAGVAISAVLFVVLLRQSTDQLMNTYVTQDYESGGAVIRVAMNLPPAILALLFRNKLGFNDYQRDMWSAFALAALATMPLVLAASFTTAIDRLALFLIPLQLAVLPRIPYTFRWGRGSNAQLILMVCAYSAAVQLVWLVFATHAVYWVPYKSVIFDT